MSEALDPILPADTILYTDGSRPLTVAPELLGVQHRNVSANVRLNDPWHVQNVNTHRLRG